MTSTPDPKYQTDLQEAVDYLRAAVASVKAREAAPDQVDALDEILEHLFESGKVSIGLIAPRKFKTTITPEQAKAKLSALLVEARIDELTRYFVDTEASEYATHRIKELEKQRESTT